MISNPAETWIDQWPGPGQCEQCGTELPLLTGIGQPSFKYAVFMADKNADYGWYCSYECVIDHANAERSLAGADAPYPPSVSAEAAS